jgi:hypothetical protein
MLRVIWLVKMLLGKRVFERAWQGILRRRK